MSENSTRVGCNVTVRHLTSNLIHDGVNGGEIAEPHNQGFPHGFGGADDVIAMPLQCSTQCDGELPDDFAITPEDLAHTIELKEPSSAVRRGDIVVIRTRQYTRVRREGWGDYAGGSALGLSFSTTAWLHASEIAGIATAAFRVLRHRPRYRFARLTDHMLGAGIIAGWNTNKNTADKTRLDMP